MGTKMRAGVILLSMLEIIFISEQPLHPFFSEGSTSLLYYFCARPFLCVCPYLMYRRNKSMRNVIETLSNFSMEKTQCFDERDRELVNERIQNTWGSLQKFDAFVRMDLKDAMKSAIGSIDVIPYHAMVSISAPLLPFFLWAGLLSPDYEVAFYIPTSMQLVLVVHPLCMSSFAFFAAVMYSKFEGRPLLCVATTFALCSASSVMHGFTHMSMWYLAWNLGSGHGVHMYSWPLFGIFSLCEILLLIQTQRSNWQNRFTREWRRSDTSYYLLWLALSGVMLAVKSSRPEI
jgi:hypothetical protein